MVLGMKSPIYEAAGYDTDLTDAEWELIEPLLYPAGARRGRGRRREAHAARALLDAIVRYLPSPADEAMTQAQRARWTPRVPRPSPSRPTASRVRTPHG